MRLALMNVAQRAVCRPVRILPSAHFANPAVLRGEYSECRGHLHRVELVPKNKAVTYDLGVGLHIVQRTDHEPRQSWWAEPSHQSRRPFGSAMSPSRVALKFAIR